MIELYTNNNKSKYSSSPRDILKSGTKAKMKNSTPSKLPQLLLLNLFARKYLMKLIFARLKYL